MTVALFNLPQTVSVALLVIGGEFGNGEERRVKLTKAGYDYKTIQSCVNELVPLLKKYGG